MRFSIASVLKRTFLEHHTHKMITEPNFTSLEPFFVSVTPVVLVKSVSGGLPNSTAMFWEVCSVVCEGIIAPCPSRVKFAWNFLFFTPFLAWNFGENFPRTPKALENIARKSSPKFHDKLHDTFGREKRRKMSLPHFCRVAALTITEPKLHWNWFGNLFVCNA